MDAIMTLQKYQKDVRVSWGMSDYVRSSLPSLQTEISACENFSSATFELDNDKLTGIWI